MFGSRTPTGYRRLLHGACRLWRCLPRRCHENVKHGSRRKHRHEDEEDARRASITDDVLAEAEALFAAGGPSSPSASSSYTSPAASPTRKAGKPGTTALGSTAEVIATLRAIAVRAREEEDVDMADYFEHFDTDFSGEIDETEFREGLASLGIEVSPAQYAALVERFHRDNLPGDSGGSDASDGERLLRAQRARQRNKGPGGIRYREFLRMVTGADDDPDTRTKKVSARARKVVAAIRRTTTASSRARSSPTACSGSGSTSSRATCTRCWTTWTRTATAS